MNSFRTFRCLTVISVVHMDAYMLTRRLQLLEVFRLHVMSRHVFETKRRKRKTSENPVLPNLKFWFCGFWNAQCDAEAVRNRSRLSSNAVCEVWIKAGSRKNRCDQPFVSR